MTLFPFPAAVSRRGAARSPGQRQTQSVSRRHTGPVAACERRENPAAQIADPGPLSDTRSTTRVRFGVNTAISSPRLVYFSPFSISFDSSCASGRHRRGCGCRAISAASLRSLSSATGSYISTIRAQISLRSMGASPAVLPSWRPFPNAQQAVEQADHGADFVVQRVTILGRRQRGQPRLDPAIAHFAPPLPAADVQRPDARCGPACR